ncbi:MAG: dodecin family protein [Nitrospinota bacterium]
MSDNDTYKIIRLAAASPVSYQDAIEAALANAKKSLKGLSWFQVVEQRGGIDSETGKPSDWQVVIDVAFKIEK